MERRILHISLREKKKPNHYHRCNQHIKTDEDGTAKCSIEAHGWGREVEAAKA